MEGTSQGDILGTGWQFPVRVDRQTDAFGAPERGRGGIAMARHITDMEQAMYIILSTRKGERRMRPTFGCDIHNLVFEPMDTTTFALARHHVMEALAMWEPRIAVRDVVIDQGAWDGRMNILIRYEVLATKDERTLVYPFYSIGEE